MQEVGWYVSESDPAFIVAHEGDGEWVAPTGASWDTAALPNDLVHLVPATRLADAWGEGFDAAEEDWQHHDRAGWGNEECIAKNENPYLPSRSKIVVDGMVVWEEPVRSTAKLEPNPHWGKR